MGKPIRPVIELQKDCSLVNIITTSVQDGNVVRDFAHDETWAVDPSQKSIAVYIDGVFKGLGHFASEEGVVVDIEKSITLEREVEKTDKEGNITKTTISGYRLIYKGIFSKLIDGAIVERGSALKPNMTQTIIYCVLVGLTGFMMGMAYAK